MRSNDDSFTRVARREQIIGATIETVAEVGLAGASLAKIAERLGIAKGSIIYHFGSRDRLIEDTLADVYQRIAEAVTAQVSGASSARDAVHRYIVALIDHLDAHRIEVRLIAEAFATVEPSTTEREHTDRRWIVLAQLLEAAFDEHERETEGRDTGGHSDDGRPDTEIMAISLSGGIDALVGRAMFDPEFDLAGAGRTLAGLSDRMIQT